MEYRGYDSVGIATLDDQIIVSKGTGRVVEVNNNKKLDQMSGRTGIGHTRWATHGKVCEANAHPHLGTILGKVAVVHNGIIENYEELKGTLTCEFLSETDSEVIANLLEYNYSKTGDPKAAMMRTLPQLKGSYAFVALFDDGTLAAARHHEPLVVGLGALGIFLASDILGFIEHTDEAIYPNNLEFVLVNPEGCDRNVECFDYQGCPVGHKIVKLSKEMVDVYKDDYAHFTLKEINEQPSKLLTAVNAEEVRHAAKMVSKAKSIFITGSGTSYNAALVAKQWLGVCGYRAEAIISSESRFMSYGFDQDSIMIAISQSGESADVIDTVNDAKRYGAKIVSIINTMTSSLARLSDAVVGLNCGPEIGVAATKSFTAQLAVLYAMTHLEFQSEMVSTAVRSALKDVQKVKTVASVLKDVQDVYILGRGVHYAIASEASLKLKELAYIHAEGLPGGELKHGPLALMDEHAYVILINPTDQTYADMLKSASQVKSRGAKIIGISETDNTAYDHWLPIPTVLDEYLPFVEIIPIQLLAYYLALERNNDPDYPRNLAKSVTVR